MEFIKKHKVVLVITLVCLILMFLAGFAVYRMFYPSGGKRVYGDRLKNAPEIDTAVINQIKDEMTDTGLVNNIDYITSVTTMKFFIDVKSDTKVEDAQKLTDIILEKLSTKVISFYDIAVYLTQNDGDNPLYPASGYHSNDGEVFNWVLNKEGEKVE